MSFATGPKVRGALINEDTGEAQGFMFNPRQLVAAIQVNWDKAPGIGASFERLGYRNTSNPEFNLTLLHNLVAWIDRTRKPGEHINAANAETIRAEFERHRNFLIALCYPRGRWNDVLRRSPPTALLMWPGYLAIACTSQNSVSVRLTVVSCQCTVMRSVSMVRSPRVIRLSAT